MALPRTELRPAEFQRFASLVGAELGIQLTPEKTAMLQNRLARRLKHLGLDSPAAYLAYLEQDAGRHAERQQFIDVVTTNKTDFFREPEHFRYLTANAIPGRDAGTPGNRPSPVYNVWCAGCSSGEEPYTLAMVLAEYAAQHAGFEFQILATDISSKVLERARQAIYPQAAVAPVPLPMRAKYLLRSRNPADRLFRVSAALRRRVTLHPLNFMDSDYRIKDQFDAIFFRNVMIYFDKPTQAQVVTKQCRNLRPGGYLFIGHSESLAGLDVPVEVIGASIYRKPLHKRGNRL